MLFLCGSNLLSILAAKPSKKKSTHVPATWARTKFTIHCKRTRHSKKICRSVNIHAMAKRRQHIAARHIEKAISQWVSEMVRPRTCQSLRSIRGVMLSLIYRLLACAFESLYIESSGTEARFFVFSFFFCFSRFQSPNIGVNPGG
ncbi:hypothetical protein BJY00DRAFT_104284 [Aspergillus carlsbadensis]|nr:hypothetical protein BJY00DRAFT_104284 [Aspergillus carlsbadensis]